MPTNASSRRGSVGSGSHASLARQRLACRARCRTRASCRTAGRGPSSVDDRERGQRGGQRPRWPRSRPQNARSRARNDRERFVDLPPCPPQSVGPPGGDGWSSALPLSRADALAVRAVPAAAGLGRARRRLGHTPIIWQVNARAAGRRAYGPRTSRGRSEKRAEPRMLAHRRRTIRSSASLRTRLGFAPSTSSGCAMLPQSPASSRATAHTRWRGRWRR